MHLAGRLQAAIEVLDDVSGRHRPAALALSDWGRAHRFAGAGDRAAIGNIVYDVLRARARLATLAGADTARALVLAYAADVLAIAPAELAGLCAHRHGPGELTPDELRRLENPPPADGLAARANMPDWLLPHLRDVFGDGAARQAAAMATRAPLDLRVNTLKSDRQKVCKALARHDPSAGPFAPQAIRIAARQGLGRMPNLEAEPAFQRGAFEIQDAASQVAAALCDARAGHQVADICAGAGGKTLALAAHMANKGQVHAWDADPHRLKPIFDRLARAGVRNAQIIAAADGARLDDLAGRMDRVLVDAPCSGSGAWRRRPDAKWRFSAASLDQRLAQQAGLLARGAGLVRPGGRLVYVTCSVLKPENTGQVEKFLAAHPGFALLDIADVWSRSALEGTRPRSADGCDGTLLLTPADHSTDGFFIAVLEKKQ